MAHHLHDALEGSREAPRRRGRPRLRHCCHHSDKFDHAKILVQIPGGDLARTSRREDHEYVLSGGLSHPHSGLPRAPCRATQPPLLHGFFNNTLGGEPVQGARLVLAPSHPHSLHGPAPIQGGGERHEVESLIVVVSHSLVTLVVGVRFNWTGP